MCELVGLYLLDLLTKKLCKQNIGLYRDHGLSCFENISGPDPDKIKKKLFNIFKSNGLSTTVECNLIRTDFLDVTFYLKSATYYPYRKQNNKLLHKNKHSNHPLIIFNQILVIKATSINQLLITTLLLKLADLMITSHIFQVHLSVKLKRDIIWFNSLYSANVKTNGKISIRLADKHFLCHHKYYKLFNRNNVKLS